MGSTLFSYLTVKDGILFGLLKREYILYAF